MRGRELAVLIPSSRADHCTGLYVCRLEKSVLFHGLLDLSSIRLDHLTSQNMLLPLKHPVSSKATRVDILGMI